MAKPKQNKVPLGTYVSEETRRAVDAFSEATGVPITRIVEDALKAYLRERQGSNSHE